MGIDVMFGLVAKFVEAVSTMSSSDIFDVVFYGIITIVVFYGTKIVHKIITFEIDRGFKRYEKFRTRRDVTVSSAQDSTTNVSSTEPTTTNSTDV
jgi:hypothetical protein